MNVIIDFLKSIEKPENYDGCVYDDCGGNVDDAFSIGDEHGSKWGRYELAKELLNLIEKYEKFAEAKK